MNTCSGQERPRPASTFLSRRGALRQFYQGHTYQRRTLGRNGTTYYVCENKNRQGCQGRMKITPANEKEVTNNHTCAPTTRPTVVPVSQRGRGAIVRGARGTIGRARGGQIQRSERPEPLPGPSSANDSEDEGVAVDANSDEAFRRLQMKHIRQKLEIGRLMKQKLQIELDILRKKIVRPVRNQEASNVNANPPARNSGPAPARVSPLHSPESQEVEATIRGAAFGAPPPLANFLQV